MVIKSTYENINLHISEIYEYINIPRVQSQLIKDKERWDQICSSLYALEDSLLAIKSFHAGSFPGDSGTQYLFIYGLLQALFLMQDAVKHLSEAIDIEYTPSERLLEIRNIRNSSIGHPTKQGKKGGLHFNIISRSSMSKHGYDLLKSNKQKDYLVKTDTLKLCSDQLNEIYMMLETITNILSKRDKMHKEKFNMQSLSVIIKNETRYNLEKIYLGIMDNQPGDKVYGQIQLDSLKRKYRKFKKCLSIRNELEAETVYHLEEYFHSIEKLNIYLNGNPGNLHQVDARIYYFFIKEKHEYFLSVAKEIDEDYQV